MQQIDTLAIADQIDPLRLRGLPWENCASRFAEARPLFDRARMSQDTQVMYALTLNPLRRDPHLPESILYGLKLTLGVMFEDPFHIRDVIIAIRELLDNMLAHADWDQTPAPSLSVRYRVHNDLPQLCISSTNVPKDIDEATRAARRINESIADTSSATLRRTLTAHLTESGSIRTSGGIGLLQVAASPRSHLELRLDGALFHVWVDVDVPELRPAPTV
jgi:hypothetical protein